MKTRCPSIQTVDAIFYVDVPRDPVPDPEPHVIEAMTTRVRRLEELKIFNKILRKRGPR